MAGRISNLAELFWGSVIPGPREECWGWGAAFNEHGYPVFHIGGRGGVTVRAHRAAFVLIRGLPLSAIDGFEVRHQCDNPSCPNPWHLNLGTHADNMQDMATRDRSLAGEKNHQAVLTWEAVRKMRTLARAGISPTDLRAAFGVSQPTVSNVLTEKTWKEKS